MRRKHLLTTTACSGSTVDGDGHLSRKELCEGLMKEGYTLDDIDKRLPNLLRSLDSDGNGEITKEEFVANLEMTKITTAGPKSCSALDSDATNSCPSAHLTMDPSSSIHYRIDREVDGREALKEVLQEEEEEEEEEELMAKSRHMSGSETHGQARDCNRHCNRDKEQLSSEERFVEEADDVARDTAARIRSLEEMVEQLAQAGPRSWAMPALKRQSPTGAKGAKNLARQVQELCSRTKSIKDRLVHLQLLWSESRTTPSEAYCTNFGTDHSTTSLQDSREEAETGLFASGIPLHCFESNNARVLEALTKADLDGNQVLDANEIVGAVEAYIKALKAASTHKAAVKKAPAPDRHEEVEEGSSASGIPLHCFESMDVTVLEALTKADLDGNQVLDANEIVGALEAYIKASGPRREEEIVVGTLQACMNAASTSTASTALSPSKTPSR